VIPTLPPVPTVHSVFRSYQSQRVLTAHSDWWAFTIERDEAKESPRFLGKDFAVRSVRGAIAILLAIICGMQAMLPCRCGLACSACDAKHCVHEAKCQTCSHSQETTRVQGQATAVEQTEACVHPTYPEPPVAPKNRCMFCTGRVHWLPERDSKWSLSDDLKALTGGPSGFCAWFTVSGPSVVQRLKPLCQRSDPESTQKRPPRMQV
jgi:hypothetical protein